jgi:hypothetical protein
MNIRGNKKKKNRGNRRENRRENKGCDQNKILGKFNSWKRFHKKRFGDNFV